MDINPLCNMIEYLTTLFIVFHRFSKSPSLHNVTLPRTWLLRTAHLEPTTNKDTRLIPLLIQPMKHLLREVYFGCGEYSHDFLRSCWY